MIYKVDIDDDRNVAIEMTLTAPGCPVAGDMPGWVENAVSTVQGVQSVKVNMVFDPPWVGLRLTPTIRLHRNGYTTNLGIALAIPGYSSIICIVIWYDSSFAGLNSHNLTRFCPKCAAAAFSFR